MGIVGSLNERKKLVVSTSHFQIFTFLSTTSLSLCWFNCLLKRMCTGDRDFVQIMLSMLGVWQMEKGVPSSLPSVKFRDRNKTKICAECEKKQVGSELTRGNSNTLTLLLSVACWSSKSIKICTNLCLMKMYLYVKCGIMWVHRYITICWFFFTYYNVTFCQGGALDLQEISV